MFLSFERSRSTGTVSRRYLQGSCLLSLLHVHHSEDARAGFRCKFVDGYEIVDLGVGRQHTIKHLTDFIIHGDVELPQVAVDF